MAKLNFPLDRSSLAVVESCGSELCDILHSKFQCVTTIEGADAAPRDKRFTATLPNGVVVSVWKANLAKFQADAVVNASNERLQHGGGLALALANAGGPQVQRDSKEYIQKNGALQTGDAVVTDAGWLNYKKIIHAVGPQLPSRPSSHELKQAEIALEKAVRNILDLVDKYGLQSVAIPAISSGIFCFPLRECTNTIVSSVKRYYKTFTMQAHAPKEIMLADIEEATVAEMVRACQQFLSTDTPPSYSHGASGRSATEVPAMTVRVEHATLTLVKGHIENQKTDVVVNIITRKSRLGQPAISGRFLHKAGDIVQKEFKQRYNGGGVTCTDPGELQCKKLFHITWYKEDTVEDLFNSVLDCLLMAVKRKHTTISIPAVFDELPKVDDERVAEAIIKAALDFARLSGPPLEVYFVVFPQAVSIFQAFQKRMQVLRQPSAPPHTSDDSRHQHSRAAVPRLSLTGESDEALHEAKHWLTRTLGCPSGVVLICNNFLQHLGRDECRWLSNLSGRGLSVEEFWENGHSSVEVRGDPVPAAVAGMKVEALVCKALKAFVEAEEKELSQLSSQKVLCKKTVLDHHAATFPKTLPDFRGVGLQVVKVEKVENDALSEMFELKKKQLKVDSPRRMFQRLPAHFCNVVCHVGFHSECAPPYEPALGEGIYFTGTVEEAMTVWQGPKEEYLYFVEAEVLTGKSAPGAPGLILPPAYLSDPQVLCHSVRGGDDVAVIFSGHQALPRYIFTCQRSMGI
ncbi:protein mono-ADP-ribosyltransferase PARP9 [Neosynchiropus ocellatus]